MEQKRFVYNNEYYEYGKEELSVYLYEEELPEALCKMLSDRAGIIDRTVSSIGAMEQANDQNKIIIGNEIDQAMEAVYGIENQIAQYMTQNNIQIDWYHPTSPKKQWEPWEEQRVHICAKCGAMYDFDASLLVLKNGHYISECPKCKSNKLFLANKYIHLGEKLREEGYLLNDQGKSERSIAVRRQEIEQLKKVDMFYIDEYKTALYQQICAYGDIAMTYFQTGHMQEANKEVEKGIACSQALSSMDQSKGYCGAVAEIFNYRMNIRMNLPGYSFDSVYSDYKESLKYNAENHKHYTNVTENFTDISEQEKKGKFKTIETIRVKTYSSMIVYCLKSGKMENARNILREFRAYISTCRYISESEKREYRELADSTLRDLGAPKSEGCYIATAVYGDYDAPQVIVLREFRDTVLRRSLLGRIFIKAYYKYSPSIAKRLKHTVKLNHMVRGVLDKLIEKLEKR